MTSEEQIVLKSNHQSFTKEDVKMVQVSTENTL